MSNRTLVKIALAVLLLTGSAFAQFGSHDVLYVVSAPTGACIAGSRLEVVITTGVVYSCQSLTWTALAGGTGISSLSITVPTGLAVSPGSLSSPGTFAFTWNGSLPVAQVPFQSLTTTGTSGPATLAGGVLNIPQYSGGGGGGIGGSGTIGTLPIFVTNTTTIGNSNVTESGGLLNIADVNGIALTATGGALYSGKIQTGTSVVVPSPNNFSTFLGSDNVYRAQLASGSLAITPASIAVPASPSTGFGVSGTGINFQTTNLTASTPGDIATYDANGNTQDSGTLGSSLANTALGNLASVGVNLALTPASDATISLDSLTKRYVNFWASGVYGWTNGSGTADTGLSRDAADTVDVGNGTAGDKSGTLKAASINASASVSAGTAPGVCGTATGCFGATEGTAANMSVTASQDAFAADATAHAFKMTLNGGAIFLSAMNASLAPTGTIALSFASAPAGTKCVQTSGAAGLVTEAAGACGSSTPSLDQVTGSAAQATATETAISHEWTYAGVETANLTYPIVFQDTNATNTTSGAVAVNVVGAGTAMVPMVINQPATDVGDSLDFYNGATFTNGVLSGGTIKASVLATGAFQSKGSTAGFFALSQGSTSSGVAPCNAANTHCIQAPVAVTASVETDAPAQAQGIPTRTGVAATIQDGYSGDANHSATVTIGSGTSIGSTSLCSTAICLVGTYRVNVYVDITTACGTTGTYVVNLIYTDDQGSKTVPVNLTGTGAVPATGVLTTTSTANFGYDSFILRSTGAASINYSTTAVACGTAGPMVGKLYLSAEPLQ